MSSSVPSPILSKGAFHAGGSKDGGRDLLLVFFEGAVGVLIITYVPILLMNRVERRLHSWLSFVLAVIAIDDRHGLVYPMGCVGATEFGAVYCGSFDRNAVSVE